MADDYIVISKDRRGRERCVHHCGACDGPYVIGHSVCTTPEQRVECLSMKLYLVKEKDRR